MQEATGKECGLHSGNVVQSAAEQAHSEALRDLWDSDAAVEPLSKEQLAALRYGPRDKATLVVLYAPWCQFSQVQRTPLPGCCSVCLLCMIGCSPTLHYAATVVCAACSHARAGGLFLKLRKTGG